MHLFLFITGGDENRLLKAVRVSLFILQTNEPAAGKFAGQMSNGVFNQS
jgi:hypothetical protein